MMKNLNGKNYTDVVEDARELLTEAEKSAGTKGVLLASAITDVTDRYVCDDDNSVKKIMAHVLDNAVKYTEAGGRVCYSVTQMPSRKPGYATYIFEANDTGIGISKECSEHLFDPVSDGGFGMYDIKQLVDIMKGVICVSSEQGTGTCVKLSLDMKIAV